MLQSARTPHLVLFSGPPGTGKSTLSYRLARYTGWALLAIDQLDRTPNGMGLADDRGELGPIGGLYCRIGGDGDRLISR